MKKSRLVQTCIAVLGIASSLAVLAAERESNSRGDRNPQVSYDLVIKDGRLLNPGGGKGLDANLGNVVDALRERYTRSNIVLAPGLGALEISDVKLRASRLAEELEAIRVASGMRFDWTGPGTVARSDLGQQSTGQNPNRATDPTTGARRNDPVPTGNDGLYILREATLPPESAPIMEAFNIGSYLRWLKAKQDPDSTNGDHEKEVEQSLLNLEEIVAEALVGLSEGPSVTVPRFRFHLGTNLLIVTGSKDSVEVVRKIVNALPTHSSSSEVREGWNERMNREMLKRYGLLPREDSQSR